MSPSPIKKLYLKLLLKFFRITGIKKYYRIQEGFLKGTLFNVHVDNDIFYGGYEKEAVEKIRAIANGKGPLVFYDIGAHYGFFSHVFSKLNPKEVFAFEPFIPNFNILLQTLHLNNITVVNANDIAIANNGQPMVQFTNSASASSNTYINSVQLPSSTPKKTVAAKSIDELVEKEDYPPPAFLKIDVEGAEYEVLLGALSTIKKYKPGILLATHDCHLPGVKESCVRLLTEYGYALEKLADKKALAGLEDFLCAPNL